MRVVFVSALAIAGGSLMVPARDEMVVQPLGVCRIEEGAIACWQIDGSPDRGLEKKVSGRLAENQMPIGFVAGKKNRYVVVRSQMARSFSFSGDGLKTGMSFLGSDGDRTLMLIRVALGYDRPSFILKATVGMPEGKPTDVPLREGEKADVDGIPIQLGATKEGSMLPWPMGMSMNSLSWHFGVDRPETRTLGTLEFLPLGRDGKPIVYSDLWGKPVDTKKGEKILKAASGPGWDWTKPLEASYAWIQTSPLPAPVLWCSMNIDPRFVAKVRVQRIVDRVESLGPFPADPVGVR